MVCTNLLIPAEFEAHPTTGSSLSMASSRFPSPWPATLSFRTCPRFRSRSTSRKRKLLLLRNACSLRAASREHPTQRQKLRRSSSLGTSTFSLCSTCKYPNGCLACSERYGRRCKSVAMLTLNQCVQQREHVRPASLRTVAESKHEPQVHDCTDQRVSDNNICCSSRLDANLCMVIGYLP